MLLLLLSNNDEESDSDDTDDGIEDDDDEDDVVYNNEEDCTSSVLATNCPLLNVASTAKTKSQIRMVICNSVMRKKEERKKLEKIFSRE